MAREKNALVAMSIACMDAYGELVTAELNLKDPEVWLPLYATVLRRLLPTGQVPTPAALLDIMLLHLLSKKERGVVDRGAVVQLLAWVEHLGKEREEAERRALVAI
ncbi:uncharacterized protein LY79DRAFT_675105 [Colletotrichum navitas]|uniref:Uncharacterized protein n=1 Tax=Colletotrichum navitas TaxID=681940 RepID=A0AAD8PJE9_9PEZI|nr:uncharacterized protein LY79DRAFT_675105 [Colletotrichum navitas]KAK1565882.1 hypothetical protein LY79DRAFT_675105 [Colletotrichum navitas]